MAGEMEALGIFGQYGLPGLVIGVLFFLLYRSMNAARADAKLYTELCLQLQERVFQAAEKIGDAVDRLIAHDNQRKQ